MVKYNKDVRLGHAFQETLYNFAPDHKLQSISTKALFAVVDLTFLVEMQKTEPIFTVFLGKNISERSGTHFEGMKVIF